MIIYEQNKILDFCTNLVFNGWISAGKSIDQSIDQSEYICIDRVAKEPPQIPSFITNVTKKRGLCPEGKVPEIKKDNNNVSNKDIDINKDTENYIDSYITTSCINNICRLMNQLRHMQEIYY